MPGADSPRAEWFADSSCTFVFDGDEAGRKGLAKIRNDLPDYRQVDLPSGSDINDIVVTAGFDALVKFLKNPRHFVDGIETETDNLKIRLQRFDDLCHANGDVVGPDTGFKGVTDAIDGWQPGLYLIGGGSNQGKSSLMTQLADQAIVHNDDTYVVVMSLDDPETTTFTKLLACKAQITYRQAQKPKHELLNREVPEKNRPDLYEQRKQALETLQELHNRFVIRDIRFGRTLKKFEKLIKNLRRKRPSDSMVVFVDSFDKMTAGEGDLQNTDTKGSLVQELKRITTEYDIAIVCSGELRKCGAKRPELDDLKDSIQMQYEPDVIWILHQAMHHNPDTTLAFEDKQGTRQPIVELICRKNKKGGFKGTHLFYFKSDFSSFSEIDTNSPKYRTYTALIKEDMASSKGPK